MSASPTTNSPAALRRVVRLWSWSGTRPVDFAFVLPFVALTVIGTLNVDEPTAAADSDAWAIACAVLASSSLILWRRHSFIAVCINAACMAFYLGSDYPGGPALLPGALALVALGYAESRRFSWVGAVLLGAGAIGGNVLRSSPFGLFDLHFVGWILAAVLAGQGLAMRSERAAAKQDRREYQRQQTLASERLRIAQDLHDSIGHAMATINVQSGVAAHVADQKPDQVRESLEAIRHASAKALDDLNLIVGSLRENESAPRAPATGLDQLPELFDRARRDGLRVSAVVSEELGTVPFTVGSAAYRVVQEALTNARRHAGPTAEVMALVQVDESGELLVSVVDDGSSSPAKTDPGAGFGLVGMRERVESTGGSLQAGPRLGRGFSVEARWPQR